MNNAIYYNKLAVHEGSHDGSTAIKLCPHPENELCYRASITLTSCDRRR